MTTASRDVRKPEDLAGLKIRVPESPVWVEMIRAFGGAPTPIPFGEVYTALQQKTVDGQENPIPTIFARKFYEVQGVLAMTRHMLQNNMLVINKDSLARLKPEHREVLMAEAARASAMNTFLQQKREASMLEDIRKSGRTRIIEDVDRDAFAAQGARGLPEARGALGQGQPRPPARRARRRPQALTAGRCRSAMQSGASTTPPGPARTCSSPACTGSSRPSWWRPWCSATCWATRWSGPRS